MDDCVELYADDYEFLRFEKNASRNGSECDITVKKGNQLVRNGKERHSAV